MFNVNICLLWTSFIISYRISVLLYCSYKLLYRAWFLPNCFFLFEKKNPITFWILYCNWSFLWYVGYDYLSCVLCCHSVWLVLVFRSMSCTYWTYPFDHCSSPSVHEEDKESILYTTFTTNSPLLFVSSYCVASFLI